jgi:high affinity sulfate transporter 1
MTRSLRWTPPRPALPGAALLRAHSGSAGDVFAGLSVAAYLVPQCLAYGRLAGVPPVRGLWAAVAALALYALLGTSSRMSVGPESASALMVGAAVASIGVGGGADRAPQVASALALAVAGVALVGWLLRLGVVADLLSLPVLTGYMTGIAVAMMVSQLPNLTGVESSESDTIPRLVDVIRRIDETTAAPLILGLAVLAGVVLLRRLRRLPGPLLVVVAAAVATAVLDLEERGVATVGDVQRGLPAIALPGIPGSLWVPVIAAAAGIWVVVVADNLLTARAFSRRAGDRIDPNQELLALAGANAAAGLVSGFPVSSSGSRTAIAEASGATSQRAGVVAAAAVLAVLAFGTPLLEPIPLAALAGLVVYAAFMLVDLPDIRRIVAFRWNEAVLMATAAAGVVVVGPLVGIGVAVAISVAELFARIARAHDAVLGAVPGLAGLHDVDDYPEAQTVPGLVVYRYDAPLCFANAEDFRRRVLDAVDDETSPVEWVLLNMEANVEVDLTALDMVEDLRVSLSDRGITLAMARVKHDLATYLTRTGVAERVGPEHIFPTLPTAVEGFRARPERP